MWHAMKELWLQAVAKAIISEELDPSPIIEPTRWKSSQTSKLSITTILFEMKISWNFLNSESSSLDPNGCVLTQTAMAGTRLCFFAQFLFQCIISIINLLLLSILPLVNMHSFLYREKIFQVTQCSTPPDKYQLLFYFRFLRIYLWT